MVSVAGPTRTSSVRARRSAPNEPGGSSLGLEHLVSRLFQLPAYRTRGRVRDLAGFLATHPMPLPCSKTPAEPSRTSPIAALATPPPVNPNRRPQQHIISRLTQGFSTRCLRFTRGVAASHARLASGWRAAPLPGGGRTLRVASKGFRLHLHPPFQDFSCRKDRLSHSGRDPSPSERPAQTSTNDPHAVDCGLWRQRDGQVHAGREIQGRLCPGRRR